MGKKQNIIKRILTSEIPGAKDKEEYLREGAAGAARSNEPSWMRVYRSYSVPVLTSQLFAPLIEHLSMSFSYNGLLKASN